MDETKPKERIEHISNSSSTTFRRCLYKYSLLYGKTKIELPDERSMGQRLGGAGHIAMQAFYTGKSVQNAYDLAYEHFDPQSAADLKAFDNLCESLKVYWPIAYMDGWEILEVEKKVELDRYQGIFDLVIRNKQGKIWIVDHKFKRSHQVSHLPMDTQVSFYLMLASMVGVEPEGLLYNIIPMDDRDKRYPVRRLVSRSRMYLANFKRDLDLQIEQMDKFYNAPTPYRNQTDNCSWDCDLYKICLKNLEKRHDRGNETTTAKASDTTAGDRSTTSRLIAIN